eukprot:gene23564-28574_t
MKRTASDSGDGSDAESVGKTKGKAESKEENQRAKKPKASGGGETVIPIGGKRKVTVSQFKGTTYVNIREFYEDKATGEEKPGSKGIALTVEQYRTLKSKGERALSDLKHEVVFAVVQRNIDVVQAEALQRATPGNALYQQWLSYDEVTELVQNDAGSEATLSWLRQNNIEITWVSRRKDYIKAVAPVAKWEELLHTQLYVYTDYTRDHTDIAGRHTSRKTFVRAQSYHLPKGIHLHINAVFNLIDAPPVMHEHIKPHKFQESKFTLSVEHTTHLRRGIKDDEEKVNAADLVSPAASSYNGFVTVSFLNKQYDISSNLGDSSLNQSVFMTSNEYFSPTDLTDFQQTFDLTIQPVSESIGNHSVFNCSQPGISCSEGNLDIQYIMGVAQKTASIFWWVSEDSNPFLTWITDVANDPYPPQSNSISWGSVETLVDASILDAFDTEASKLAVMGVTITVATGDNGAPDFITGLGCLCSYNSGSSESSWTGSNTWTGSGYFPSFPATSPWVLAIGATMGNNGGTSGSEVACQSQEGGVITTGGGFSTHYAMPSYQTDHVNGYFSQLSVLPTQGYNRQGRAYPDLAYIGVRYLVDIAQDLQVIYGTSASSPVMAAMVTLVNTQRMKAGLTSIGFINPTLYAAANANMYKDVTSGHNKCCAYSGSNPGDNAVCCASGFDTAVGWDPVTGLGVASYPSLCSMFNVTAASSETSGGGASSGLSQGAAAAITIVVLVVAGGAGWWCFRSLCNSSNGSKGNSYAPTGSEVQHTISKDEDVADGEVGKKSVEIEMVSMEQPPSSAKGRTSGEKTPPAKPPRNRNSIDNMDFSISNPSRR